MVVLLAQRIELARIEARRRRHPAAEPLHLLAAVLETAEFARALRERGIDPLELREKLDAQLAASDSLGGYRDGSDTPLAPALARVLERLARRRWRLLGARTTCVEALLPEPSVAALVFALRRGNDSRHVIERATALAVMSAHASVGIEHAFRVLLDLRSFVETLERAEGNLARLRETVDATLSRSIPSRSQPGMPPLGPVMRRVVSSAKEMARRTGVSATTVRQLCLDLAHQEEAEPFWTAAGIEHSAFVRAIHIPDGPRLPLT